MRLSGITTLGLARSLQYNALIQGLGGDMLVQGLGAVLLEIGGMPHQSLRIACEDSAHWFEEEFRVLYYVLCVTAKTPYSESVLLAISVNVLYYIRQYLCNASTLVAGGIWTTVSCSSVLVAICEDSALVGVGGAGIP